MRIPVSRIAGRPAPGRPPAVSVPCRRVPVAAPANRRRHLVQTEPVLMLAVPATHDR